MKKIFFLMLLATVVVACKNSKPAAAALPFERSNLYVRYDETSKELMSTAVFFKDTVKVSLPKGILFQGIAMVENRLIDYGTRYKVSQKFAECPLSLNYKFADAAGEGHEIGVNMPDFRVPAKQDSFSLSKGATIRWEGEALKKDETLVVLMEDEIGHLKSLNILGPTTSSNIVLRGDVFAELPRKEIRVSLVRKGSLNDVASKTIFEWEYYAMPFKTPLVP